jgi:hypothetical protein
VKSARLGAILLGLVGGTWSVIGAVASASALDVEVMIVHATDSGPTDSTLAGLKPRLRRSSASVPGAMPSRLRCPVVVRYTSCRRVWTIRA